MQFHTQHTYSKAGYEAYVSFLWGWLAYAMDGISIRGVITLKSPESYNRSAEPHRSGSTWASCASSTWVTSLRGHFDDSTGPDLSALGLSVGTG